MTDQDTSPPPPELWRLEYEEWGERHAQMFVAKATGKSVKAIIEAAGGTVLSFRKYTLEEE